MKYLILIGMVVLLLWLARTVRPRVPGDSRRSATSAPPAPQPMVRCAHCGLHLPEQDALPGRGGHYCSEEHRRAAGG
ncbi:PP0621 family protein [Schlegelella aquatica]|uniref:PP0621 family protein n=1 Tax=Caldimonas aquatica TaxID=376175 RepID=UPI0037536B28